MKNHPMKRFVSLMMAVLMIVSMVPVSVFADPSGTLEGSSNGVLPYYELNTHLKSITGPSGPYAVGGEYEFELTFNVDNDTGYGNNTPVSYSFPTGIIPISMTNDSDGIFVGYEGIQALSGQVISGKGQESKKEFSVKVKCRIDLSVGTHKWGNREDFNLSVVKDLKLETMQDVVLIRSNAVYTNEANQYLVLQVKDSKFVTNAYARKVNNSFGAVSNATLLSTWSFEKVEGSVNQYLIKNINSSKYLKLANSSASLDSNATQKFYVEEINGSYTISTIVNNNRLYLNFNGDKYIGSTSADAFNLVSLPSYTVTVHFGGNDNGEDVVISRQKNSTLLPFTEAETKKGSTLSNHVAGYKDCTWKDESNVSVMPELVVSSNMTIYPEMKDLDGKTGALLNQNFALQSSNDYSFDASFNSAGTLDSLPVTNSGGSYNGNGVYVTTWEFTWKRGCEYSVQDTITGKYLSISETGLSTSSTETTVYILYNNNTIVLTDGGKTAVKKGDNKYRGFGVNSNRDGITFNKFISAEKFTLVENVTQPSAVDGLDGKTGALYVTVSMGSGALMPENNTGDNSGRMKALKVKVENNAVSSTIKDYPVPEWRFINNRSNFYAIQSVQTGKYLTVTSFGNGGQNAWLGLSNEPYYFSVTKNGDVYYILSGFYQFNLGGNNIDKGFGGWHQISISDANGKFGLLDPYKETVAFDLNGGIGDKPEEVSAFAGETIVLPACNATREDGFVFSCWSIVADGTGERYMPDEEFVVPASSDRKPITLYAVWQPKHVTVTFDKNGGTNGTKVFDETVLTEPGVTITLPEYDGEKNGWRLVGWTTNKKLQLNKDDDPKYNTLNGQISGNYLVVYKGGDSFTVPTDDITLYAAWTPVTPGNLKFGLRLDGKMPMEPSQYGDKGVYTTITRVGGGFDKNNSTDRKNFTRYEAAIDQRWFVDQSTSISYLNTDSDHYWIDNDVSANIISGKFPTVEEINYSLKNDPNNKTSTKSFNPDTQYVIWYVMKKTTKGEDYWHIDGVIRNKALVNVYYHSNVPSNAGVDNVPLGYETGKGSTVVVDDSRPTRSGYRFDGWALSSDGAVEYQPGQTYGKITEDVHFYARWRRTERNERTISGTIEWVDNEEYNDRPEKITVTLKNITTGAIETRDTTAADGWGYEFTVLLYDNATGKNYKYEIIGQNDACYHDPESFGYDLKYTWITDNYTFTKTWDDADNKEGLRPESIKISLYEVGRTEPTYTDIEVDKNTHGIYSEGKVNAWQRLFENFPKYRNRKEIVYKAEEESIAGYSITSRGNMVITNTLTTSFAFEKIWNDAGSHPESIKVNLIRNGEVYRSNVEVSGDPNAEKWEYTFENLTKYNSARELFNYTVEEAEVPEGYMVSYSEDNASITNTLLTEATVVKVWNDADDQDGKRPKSLTVTLSDGQTVTLNEENHWSATIYGLPKYSNGIEIVYTWTEGTMPAGYSLSKTTKEGTVTTLTNSYTPETTEATVKKVWDDANNQDGKRPTSLTVKLSNGTEVTLNEGNGWEAKVENLPKYANGVEIEYTWTEGEMPEGYSLSSTVKEGTVTTLTNHRDIEKTEATVKKVWDDANNQDGKRPTSLTVKLSNGTEVTLNEGNGWEAKVENLPKYANGIEIEYTWTEGEMPEGYSLSSTVKEGTVTTLTNHRDIETTEATVTKVWDDNNNQDGVRPESLTVTLEDGIEATEDRTVTLSASNSWTATINNLPVNAGGQPISYSWTEGTVNGYDLTGNETVGTTTTLTNTHLPATTERTVTKVWNDNNNQDGVRPESLTVTLSDGQTVTLNAANEWTATISNLPVNANGQPISYSWTEGTVNGYDLTGNETVGTTTTLTNTHVPATTERTVTKVWDDNNNQDGIRPTSLNVTLSDNVEATDDVVVTLSAANGWSATIENLPVNANGRAITYSWSEAKVNGYERTDTAVNGTITTLTNTHTPYTTERTVTKVWDDNNNQDGNRPENLTVTLSDGQSVTLNEENNWTATISGLPVNANGQAITYGWTEAEVEGYELTGTAVNGTITTLTNSHTPETTERTVTKVWNDNNNQDGIRPENLTVTLSNGQTVTLNEGNGWTATVTELPVNANGQAITYSWTEAKVDGYELTGTVVNGTITTLTNSHTPYTTERTVTKVWDDANNQDGIRPESLTVTLSDGQTVTLNAANSWTATIENLPVNANGQAIEYSWTEGELLNGYTLSSTAVEGTTTTLTNSHTPYTTERTVTKVWDDANNQDGIRPENLTVTLSNGQTVTLNAANSWTATIDNLPVNANGQAIEYSWTEGELPNGYTLSSTAVEGTTTTLTNSHTPYTTERTVTKVWDDANNQDGIRPDSLTVTLSDGQTVTLNAANNWTATIEDLPVNTNGQAIEYSWTEGELPNDYSLSNTAVDGTTTILTNTHTPYTTERTVTKVWDDANNQDGIRPESLTVTLSNGQTVTLNAANSWTATINNLPVNAAGEPITYSWTEAEVEGYELSNTAETATATGTVTTLTNTHTPATTSLTIAKIWDDAQNQDGKRPTSLNVTLSDNVTTTDDVVVTLSNANNWRATVNDLPVYAAGSEIVYTWTEAAVEGYTLSNTTVNGTVTTITNTHTPELITISGTKTWNDDNNRDGIRPTQLRVTLVADGRLTDRNTVITGEGNVWNYTFTDVPRYENGREIVYSVNENEVPGYTGMVDGMNLVNVHGIQTVTVSGTKTWADQNNVDNLRPNSITVNLLADGTPIDSRTVTANGGWRYSFENLPAYSNGQLINYTVTENNVPDYTGRTIGYNLVNTHTPIVPDVTMYTLTIHYWANNEKAFDDYIGTYAYGSEYNVTSPAKSGYTVDQKTVQGVITENTELNVYYAPDLHSVKVFYLYLDGSTAADTYSAYLASGDSYRVESPAIEGYTPTREVVEGQVVGQDVEAVVTYIANPTETEEEENPNNTRKGNNGLTLITEYGTPLAALSGIGLNTGEGIE